MRKFDVQFDPKLFSENAQFFSKKITNGSKFDGKIFSAEECPQLGRKRNCFVALHGAGGKEEAVTLIHNSHPSLDFLPILWVSLPCWPVIENTSGHQPSYFITYRLLVIDFYFF
jgi:hypothetical protein